MFNYKLRFGKEIEMIRIYRDNERLAKAKKITKHSRVCRGLNYSSITVPFKQQVCR